MTGDAASAFAEWRCGGVNTPTQYTGGRRNFSSSWFRLQILALNISSFSAITLPKQMFISNFP